ncbi:MAG: ABC transporter substrate-binding protein [Actinomycetota bacterium]
MKRSTKVGSRGWRFIAALAAGSLLVAACGSDDEGASDSDEATTEAPVDSAAPMDSGAPTDSAAPAEGGLASDALGAPTGDEIVIGMVNTEGGAGGLDFPDIRRFLEAGVGYSNEHGGLGNRPIRLESCVVKGDPETSQACAQELVGKGVELVLVGLDLFIDYNTTASAYFMRSNPCPNVCGSSPRSNIILTLLIDLSFLISESNVGEVNGHINKQKS